MMRREASRPAGKINSPSQGPQFTRLIWTFPPRAIGWRRLRSMLSSPPEWHLREGGFGRPFQELRRAVASTFLFSCELESAAKPTGFIHFCPIAPLSSLATNPGRGHAARLIGLGLMPILGLDIGVANLHARRMTSFRARLLAIMLMDYET